MLFHNLKNSLVIYNKISQNLLYKKEQENVINNIDNAKSIIISIIGTIDTRKNQQKFICDVFYNIVDNLNCNVKLFLIGKLYTQINIVDKYKNNIIFIKEVNNSIPYIKASDIIVSYSLNEVFPLNILEAFYCKKPVVSSNVGAVSEIIDDNINGFLFDSNDATTCYNLLYKLIHNENLRKQIGEKAYEKYCDKFNLDTNFQDYLYLLGFN
jgi:glycosyltransferase involved in cell wall biosynthesis